MAGLWRMAWATPGTLAVPPRQGGDRLDCLILQLGAGDGPGNERRPLCLAETVQGRGIIEIIEDRHFRIYRAVFRQIADLLLDRTTIGADLPVTHGNGAAGRFEIAGDHLHDRRLTGPVVPQEPDNFPRRDGKRDIVNRRKIPVSSRNIFYFDHFCSML